MPMTLPHSSLSSEIDIPEGLQQTMIYASKIRQYIHDNLLFGSERPLDDNESLLDAGIIDSTGAMELVSFLESEFGIAIDDRDLIPENLDSIRAMDAFVSRKRPASSPSDPRIEDVGDASAIRRPR